MLPLFLGIVIIAIAVNVAQVGFHLSTAKLRPNLGALNPLRGLGRLFKGNSLVHLLLGILKLALVTLAAYSAVHGRIAQIIAIQNLSQTEMLQLGGEVLFSIGIRVGLVLLILAVLDYAWQRWELEKSLKMTKQEVKDEMRNMEGDPKLKQRRRQVAMQIAQRKLKKDVPTADVVVTNPTEFAVALKYDAAAMHAPRVIAKGQGLIAQRIREIAIEAGVPILERKPLARALYKLVEVGQEIPEEFYSAVAEILAYVYELTGKVRRKLAV
jgi:flagellar biosynthetic protein FlhB